MSEPLTALIASTEAALERHKQGLLGPTGVSALLMDTLHQLRGLDAARPSGEVDVDWLSDTLASLEGKEELHILDAYSYDEAAGIIVAEYDALRFAALDGRREEDRT